LSKLYEKFGISDMLVEKAKQVEIDIQPAFIRINDVKEHNQLKVIAAMQAHKVSDTHFSGSTGYGYNDRGREVLEAVYATAFGTEAALVRQQITCGSHALAIALYGLLRPGDELLSITGKPYDTLEEVIGIRGKSGNGSLKDYGISYSQLDLLPDGEMDLQAIPASIKDNTRLVFIQRSRGYMLRKPTTIEHLKQAVDIIRAVKPGIRIMVDNCYGEFTENDEPTDVGVDLIAGSLIKNPGGGLALSGGYIAGTHECVELAAYRMTLPGIGGEVGATLGQNRLMFQGFFMAPHVVAESIKGAVFAAAMMKSFGYEVYPDIFEARSDLTQAVNLGSPEAVIAFCQGIQKGSAVDSFVNPEPWDMPGYDSPVIMAAGAFVQGSSIELSADAPIRAPYTVYLQGGLVYEHVKLGVMRACSEMQSKGLLKC
jgi:cystathionine beta-lyase family protein involved in aluminum resistance